MLDMSHMVGNGYADIQTFVGDSANATTHWRTWIKPRGKSMCHIMLLGKGGNGGTGVIGAVSTAAGGGGGGSGGQTSLLIPMHMLPDVLHLSLAGVNPSSTAISSYVSVAPGAIVANNIIAVANGGAAGGNGSAGTAGTGGAGGGIATVSTMPLGWAHAQLALVGQTGGAGGTSSVTPPALALPVTGLLVTGGTGGGGLGAAGTAGSSGGVLTGAGAFPSLFNQLNTGVATDPPYDGTGGIKPVAGVFRYYGGVGGNAGHGSATGAGLKQACGGHAAYGCGGGGMGGALTGSTAGVVGLGGPALCVITSW